MAKEMTIGIVGAGQMGGGIAQVASQAGLPVILYDLRPETLRTSQSEMRKSLLRLQRGGKMTEPEAAAVLERVRLTSDFDHLGAADFVIEAAPENFDIKKSTMQYLDELCAPEVVFASNTSSISLTQLGAATSRPDKVIGMHFMNPPAVLPLVEIVRGLGTSDATEAAARDLATRMGKRVVRVNDYPGFIVNRLLLPMINEAIYAVYEGVASADDIDGAMKVGTNQPMGPLALADLIGLDTCLAVLENLYASFGNEKYRPCPLLRNLVAAGHLGRKSGKGFYEY